ncbi:MAG: hypothetical protein JWN70_3118 [Planctomycetaceae bacterium]|nr:hypothetical protein [Planctomycetaceae bacterium]
MLRQFLSLILIAIGPAAANAESPMFDALLRDGRRSTGVLTGGSADGFQFQSRDTGTVSLDRIQSLELRRAPHSLPDRGWKRLTLINGDVLHAKPIATDDASPLQKSTTSNWITNFETPVNLPLAALVQVSHPAGTRGMVYQDFEADSEGWLNPAGGTIPLNREQCRSGLHSLKCSADAPFLKYELAEPLEKGWLEFSFFLAPDSKSVKNHCSATIQIVDGTTRHEVPISLIGDAAWYEVKLPDIGVWQRHNIARRPGWHSLVVAIQPDMLRLTVDDYPLAECQLSMPARRRLSMLTVTTAGTPAAVWIDDFAVTLSVAELRFDALDRERDQVDLTTGDQLFGKLVAMTGRSMTLQADTQQTVLKWSDLSGVHFAVNPSSARAAAGRIVQIELQSWNNTSLESSSDSLSGALIAIDSQSCTLDHPLCGHLKIPWKQVWRLRPAFYGRQWSLEGRPFHLGDEVKSALQTKIPDGTLLDRTIDIQDIRNGAAYISLTAVDLEPAGPGTLDHPWLKRLQAGELTTELWVNYRRISVLNSEVTGRGTANRPQRLRIKVPIDALQPGKNRLEIRLKPSRGEPVEYDDWELRDWRFELETQPATSKK